MFRTGKNVNSIFVLFTCWASYLPFTFSGGRNKWTASPAGGGLGRTRRRAIDRPAWCEGGVMGGWSTDSEGGRSEEQKRHYGGGKKTKLRNQGASWWWEFIPGSEMAQKGFGDWESDLPHPLPNAFGSSVKSPVFRSVCASHQRVLAPPLQSHGTQQKFCWRRRFQKEKTGEHNRLPQLRAPIPGFHRRLRGRRISETHLPGREAPADTWATPAFVLSFLCLWLVKVRLPFWGQHFTVSWQVSQIIVPA